MDKRIKVIEAINELSEEDASAVIDRIQADRNALDDHKKSINGAIRDKNQLIKYMKECKARVMSAVSRQYYQKDDPEHNFLLIDNFQDYSRGTMEKGALMTRKSVVTMLFLSMGFDSNETGDGYRLYPSCGAGSVATQWMDGWFATKFGLTVEKVVTAAREHAILYALGPSVRNEFVENPSPPKIDEEIKEEVMKKAEEQLKAEGIILSDDGKRVTVTHEYFDLLVASIK